MRLKNKVVLVTGGAQGIGAASVRKFIEEGAKVVGCDVNTEAGKKLFQELGEPHAFYHVDIANRDQVEKWIKEVMKLYRQIDILVNNAGIIRDNFLVKVKDNKITNKMSEEDFDAVLQVNIKGVFNCTQVVVPHMIEKKSGVILNASSIVASHGNMGQSNYVASKAAVAGMTQVWARELGKFNIRVNTVSPGFIQTDMVKDIPEKIIVGMKNKTPLGRLGQPEDVAKAYVWLATDEASFITGANIPVNGGLVSGT